MNIEIISDLEGYLVSLDTKNSLFTGSFNPTHIGHVEVIREILKFTDQTLLVFPHLSPHKKYSTDLSIRVRWLRTTLETFLYERNALILLVQDEHLFSNFGEFVRILEAHRSKLTRFVSIEKADKSYVTNNPNNHFVIQNPIHMSSTQVRGVFEKNEDPSILEGKIAMSLVEEYRTYFQTRQ